MSFARGVAAIVAVLSLAACRAQTGGLGTDDSFDAADAPAEDGSSSDASEDTIPLFPAEDGSTPPPPECAEKADGTPCGSGTPRTICVAGSCVPSRCGDKIVDVGEDCDDGNLEDNDGCPNDCKWKCKDAAGCEDANECTEDSCDPTLHVCVHKAKTGPCKTAGGEAGTCNGTSCALPTCGNGKVESPEVCDDGNTNDSDGCKSDCTWTCDSNVDCDDKNACNGVETCDLAKHTCKAGTNKSCSDGNACTTDRCSVSTGACSNTLVDNDGDGFAPTSLGSCGKDCHDGNPDVRPNQTKYFVLPYLRGTTATWDYDCDGKNTLRYPNKGSCVKSGGSCTYTFGWAYTVPGCGGSDHVITGCEGGSCKPVVSLLRYAQECR